MFGAPRSPFRVSLKAGYCLLTGLHIYAAFYYGSYLFFHLRDLHGFSARQNLLVAAIIGAIYVPASWYGGRFAQRRGYFTALKGGFGGLALALAIGAALFRPLGLSLEAVVLVTWTVALCFTWAPLEALTSESSSRAGTARMVGIYNLVWSGGAAVAYFTGGALLKALGGASLYWLPAAVHAGQFALVLWLEGKARLLPGRDQLANPLTPALSPDGGEGESIGSAGASPYRASEDQPDFAQHHVSPAAAKMFLRMAWVANPFAYVAMNTVIPLVPELAERFKLTTAAAGFVGSVWMFTRLGAFALLWKWTAWHYRFGWLAWSYVVMTGSFVAVLLAPNLAVLVCAQLAFGLAVGLIYYSSLFYSMDVGAESQGEHGGYHETVIGAGLFAGPAVGAAMGYLAPGATHGNVLAVTAILLAGLPVLLVMKRRVLNDSRPGAK